MMKKQQGFTLIELVAVIVILGALAVVALPRFINLQDEAEQAAAEGVAGAVAAAFATNYAASLVKNGTPVTLGNEPGTDSYVTVDDATALNASDMDTSLMSGSPLNGNYTVGTCTPNNFSGGAGTSVSCELNSSEVTLSPAPTFTAIATS